MNKPSNIINFNKSIFVGECPSFKNLILCKEKLYYDVLKEFNGVLPVSINDDNYFIDMGFDGFNYEERYIEIEIRFNYNNPNFETEMRAYEAWKREQKPPPFFGVDTTWCGKLKEKIKKNYELRRNNIK
jgi:hypothetical protein